MAKPRKPKAHIPAQEKLAAALLMCVRPDASGKLVRVISHEEAKRMTARQVIQLFDFHHWPIQEKDGGPALAWNLTPLPRKVHQKETGRLRTQAAKDKRVREKYGAPTLEKPRACGKTTQAPFIVEPQRKGRPMPGSKASPFKRTMRGKVVPRHQPEAHP